MVLQERKDKKEKMSMIARMRGLLKRRDFKIFARPFELNIIGLRNKNRKKADEIHLFYKINQKNWNYHVYQAITDTAKLIKGKNNPILLKEGQYTDAYKIGVRDEDLTALIETEPVTVIQNYDRNSYLDKGKIKKGLFKIDIIPLSALEKEDEGSQVFLNEENFKEFMSLCKRQEELYGNSFTYTLIDFAMAKKSLLKKGIAVAATLLTTLLLGLFFEQGNKKRGQSK